MTVNAVDSVWPLYGPVAGGTRVTVTGQSLNMFTVAAVYFGQQQGLSDKHSSEENMVFATTPPVNETARHLAIELVLNDGSRINTNHAFEYRGNPVFADIRPRDHLAVGGTEVTVTGSNLNSVAEPRITLTVVITRFYDDMDATTSKNETDSEPCQLPGTNVNGSEMLCRMPEVILPDDLSEQLEKNGSEKARHRRTYTQGPGVAVYVSSDRRVRADVYIGLKLDGFTRYQNISSVDPDIKMQFALPPTILCKSDNLDFDPSKRQFISIKGRHLRRGCREVDYDIRLGVAACVLVSLTDNQVDCRPPTDRPNAHVNHTFCHGGTLSLQLMIGNAKYHCYCVNYVPRDNAALIACLTVGIVHLCIIFIVVILYCRRESKLTRQEASKDHTRTSTHLNIEDEHYSRGLPSDEKESRGVNVFDCQYSKKLPDDQGEEFKGVNINQYEKQLPSNLSEQEKSRDNFATSEDLKNDDKLYCRRLPDDHGGSRDLEVLDNQYSKQLLDDKEEESRGVNVFDNQYSRQLPDDHKDSRDLEVLGKQYSKQFPDDEEEEFRGVNVFDNQYSRQLPCNLSEQEKSMDNFTMSEDLENDDELYCRRLPDDHGGSRDLGVLDNQYSKQLPDDQEESYV